MGSGAAGWVLAVDVRADPPSTAVGDAGGARLEPSSTSGGAPLAVVAVHPATWDDARVAAALGAVTAHLSRPGWPDPVPLPVTEAAAWRALGFGLLPAHGRVVVLDPGEPEAAVVDRDGDVLEATGRAVAGAPGTTDPAALVALARTALDATPAGPPFSGVLLAGALPPAPAGAQELPAVLARVTGHPPLLAGDPATAAVLGAAALGWAAVGNPGEATPAGRQPRGAGGQDVVAVPARVAAPAALPVGRRGRRSRWWLLAVAALVLAAVAGLVTRGERSRPSPYTYTCPDGVVVAYREECGPLAPSSGP